MTQTGIACLVVNLWFLMCLIYAILLIEHMYVNQNQFDKNKNHINLFYDVYVDVALRKTQQHMAYRKEYLQKIIENITILKPCHLIYQFFC